MADLDLILGIDSSTQSTSGIVIDRRDFSIAARARVGYRDDPRLASYGLTGPSPVLPPREPGEADQPPGLFLDALECLLADLGPAVLGRVAAVNVSAQQHGQVWLGAGGETAVSDLRGRGCGAEGERGLAARIGPGFSYDRAPIWMTSSTAEEAEELRSALGGRDAMTARSGSDSPLRFSGAVLRRTARRFPEAYARTTVCHLLSSFLSAILSGRPRAPVDWGNGAGTSLMDWSGRRWDPDLLEAASRGLPDGAAGLAGRLPLLSHPLAAAGGIAAYFSERFGFDPACVVLAGSGDNPQSKVLAPGALLSLGTSFVFMTDGTKPHPAANAMYDGLGTPFLFGCRTNGALCWESVRTFHGLGANDFRASERALAVTAPGSVLRVLQGERESFPESRETDYGRPAGFEADYAGVVDSSLGLIYLASRPFAADVAAVAVTGGAAASEGTLRRIAAIWNRPVAIIGEAGAAAGAAVAAAAALEPESGRDGYVARAAGAVSRRGGAVDPVPADVRAYHGESGYLSRLEDLLERGALGI